MFTTLFETPFNVLFGRALCARVRERRADAEQKKKKHFWKTISRSLSFSPTIFCHDCAARTNYRRSFGIRFRERKKSESSLTKTEREREKKRNKPSRIHITFIVSSAYYVRGIMTYGHKSRFVNKTARYSKRPESSEKKKIKERTKTFVVRKKSDGHVLLRRTRVQQYYYRERFYDLRADAG